MSENEEKAHIRGIIEKIIFQNKDNGYHVLKADITGDGKEFITITINQFNVNEGVTYEFYGEWTKTPQYGKQFKANYAIEQTPSTIEGIRRYLSSSFFPGIGPVISERIIKYFGENVLEIFENDVDKLLTVPGISKNKLEAIKDSWATNKEINGIMIFLQGYGISTLFASKIYEHYKNNCVIKMQENPYSLTKFINGIGFHAADKIALNMGMDEKSPERIEACIKYILEKEDNEGHCYLTDIQIIEHASKLLVLNDVKIIVTSQLKALINKNEIVLLVFEDNVQRYYSKRVYNNEKYCADRITSYLVNNNSNIEIHNDEIEKVFSKMPIELSEEQKSSVKGILNHKVSILTGGAGVGKSSVTKAVVDLLYNLDAKFVLAAPTGKAAKRMTELLRFEASTIHRLLVWDPTNGTFVKNEVSPLEAEYIILDEASMIDINLAASILRATRSDAKLILIGDKNQLLPVGPGGFFKELINSDLIPVYKLTKIYRQSSNSFISDFANEINNGIVPTIDSPMINPSLWNDKTDCMFIDTGFKDASKPKNSYPAWSTLSRNIDFFDIIKKLYTETIKKYHELEEIQILIPMNVGDAGCIKINQMIQKEVNPHNENKREIKFKDKVFREGDKVIQTSNNYDLNVFNGDIGRIISIHPEHMACEIQFQDEKIVKYEKSDIFELNLAYAISVHKSQGSEFEAVILPVIESYGRMLYRSLYYTGITRGKKLVILCGSRRALSIAVNNVKTTKRQTSLIEMLKENMEIINI